MPEDCSLGQRGCFTSMSGIRTTEVIVTMLLVLVTAFFTGCTENTVLSSGFKTLTCLGKTSAGV